MKFALYWIVLFDSLGFGLLVPVLPFLALHFGASATLVTSIAATYYLAAVVATPLLGHLSDVIGRVGVLLLTVFAAAVSAAGLLQSGGVAGLIAFRALGGAASGNGAIAQALVTDGVPAEDHAGALSTLGAIRSVGTIAGPVLGGGVAALAGAERQFVSVLWFALALALATIGLTVHAFGRVLAPAALRSKGNGAQGHGSPEAAPGTSGLGPLLLPVAATVLMAFPTGILLTVTALYVGATFGWGIAQTGMLLGVCSATTIVSRLVWVPYLTKHFSMLLNLAAMATLALAAILVVPSTHSRVVFTLAYVVFSAASANALVFSAAMASTRAPQSSRGRWLGLNQAAFALGLVLSAVLNGVLFQYGGPQMPFYAGAATLALFSAGIWVALGGAKRAAA